MTQLKKGVYSIGNIVIKIEEKKWTKMKHNVNKIEQMNKIEQIVHKD